MYEDSLGPEETMHEGRFLHLVRRAFPGGQWEYTKRPNVPGIAVMLALTDDGMVPLVRQFRVPVGAVVWELPAGLCDRDEPLETTAVRELEEECGLTAERVTWLMRTPACQASSAMVLDFYLLEGIREVVAPPGDEVFPIERRLVPLQDLEDFLADRASHGEVVDARILAAACIARRRLRDRAREG